MSTRDLQLPVILAGPVLRRCDARAIRVWMCTSTSLTLTGTVSLSEPGRPPVRLGVGQTVREVRLGERLYVQIVVLEATEAFGRRYPTGVVLSYDLALKSERASRLQTHSIFDGLIERSAIAPKGVSLPGLVLSAGEQSSLTAYFGSCRKIGGEGDDAIVTLDEELQRTAQIASQRPSCLILLGDQIYADDVPSSTFGALLDLSVRVGGKWAVSPVVAFEELFAAPDTRGNLVRLPDEPNDELNNTGFTVDAPAGANHLLTEYEYAAAHILAWNDNLWPAITRSTLARAKRPEPLMPQMPRDAEQRRGAEAVERYVASTASMRRVMANIPTYMLFDDHDVTDDWNFDGPWRSGLKALGRSAESGALIAYAAFQNWGHQEDPKADRAMTLIEESLKARARTTATISVNARRAAELGEGLKAMNWMFQTPTTPAFRFLDSRTKREPASVRTVTSLNKFLIPTELELPLTDCLVSGTALAMLGIQKKGEAPPCIAFATPTPIISHHQMEWLKRILYQTEGLWDRDVRYTRDLEGWDSNPESQFRFFDLLFTFNTSKCIVLAGDVHYSYSLRARIARDGKTVDVLQLCSSALKNELPQLLQQSVRKIDVLRRAEVVWWWKPGDSRCGVLYDPASNKAQMDMMLTMYGTPRYRVQVEVFPLDWAPIESMTSSIAFESAIGELRIKGGEVTVRHLSRREGRTVPSRPVSIPLRTP